MEDKFYIKGVTKLLLDEGTKEKINSFFLFLFCNEGDNIPHSIEMFKNLLFVFRFINTEKVNIKFPSSWNKLYG